jgi:hypothetical protein
VLPGEVTAGVVRRVRRVQRLTFDDALGDWLGKTLRDWDGTPEPLAGRGGGYRLTLPNEAEWERAARAPRTPLSLG